MIIQRHVQNPKLNNTITQYTKYHNILTIANNPPNFSPW